MRIIIVAAITLLAGAARADTSPIVMPGATLGGREPMATNPPPTPEPATGLGVGAIKGGTLDRMALAIEATPGGVRATWTLDVSTTSREMRELAIPITVSSDVAIIGLRLSIAGAEPLVGEILPSASAVVGYESFVQQAIDPALLEWVRTTATREQLRLRVFPIVKGAPATITIEMWLPGGNQLELDPGPRRIAEVAIQDAGRSASWKKLATRRTWSLPMTSPLPPEEPADIRGVTHELSLVAGPYSLRSGIGPRYSSRVRSLGHGFHEHVPVTPVMVAEAEGQ